jgi:hypothetical protein
MVAFLSGSGFNRGSGRIRTGLGLIKNVPDDSYSFEELWEQSDDIPENMDALLTNIQIKVQEQWSDVKVSMTNICEA